MRKILLKHLLRKVCSLCVDAFVVRQVSQAYRRTDFTFVLKICSFVFTDAVCEFHSGFNALNAAVAFPILVQISLVLHLDRGNILRTTLPAKLRNG